MRSIRRVRSIGGLFAAACLMVASACGADSTDQLVSPPAPDAADLVDAPVATWAPTAGATQPVRMETSTPVAVSAPFGASMDVSEFVPAQWLVPWDDGFLAVGVFYPPQALPDRLPPEVAALFPPEVNALFPDGLPPTQTEAMDILREAGLLDVVMDILNDNPDAMDAVQSAPPSEPELVASWTLDGDAWAPVEMIVPDGISNITQLTVSGDRLTVAGSDMPDDGGGPWTVTVASTTDLENWVTASFPRTQPEGLAEDAQMWVTPTAVAADDGHWVVRIMVDTPVEYGAPASGPVAELWSGAWGGEPEMNDSGHMSWSLLATSAGFLDFGDQLAFSPDGRTWTEVPDPGANISYQSAAPLGDDVLAITSTPYGESSIVVLDATGTRIREVDFAELGDGFWTWGSMASSAFVVAATTPAPTEMTLVVEHEGFELTQQYGEVAAYQLVELSTGEVVAEESVDLRTTEIGDDGFFEYLVEDESGITITDSETGAPIVEIPRSVIDRAWNDAQGGDEATEFGPPDLWLLATTDGETWLVEDLVEDEVSDGYTPTLVAMNGTTVLVGTIAWEPNTTETWQRFTMIE